MGSAPQKELRPRSEHTGRSFARQGRRDLQLLKLTQSIQKAVMLQFAKGLKNPARASCRSSKQDDSLAQYSPRQ